MVAAEIYGAGDNHRTRVKLTPGAVPLVLPRSHSMPQKMWAS